MSDGLITLESSELYEEKSMEPEFDFPGAKTTWTMGLTWICIFCALISFTGVLSALFGFAGIILQPVLSEAMSAQVSDVRIQHIQEQYDAAMKPYRPVLLFQQMVKFGLASAFGIGCVMLLMRSSRARSFVLTTCAGAIVFHVLAAVLHFMTMNAMTDVAVETGKAAIDSGVAMSPELERNASHTDKTMAIFTGMMSFGTTIGVAIGLAIKGIFYGCMMQCLCTPTVRSIFGENPYPELGPLQTA